MRAIRKGAEPWELRRYRAGDHARYKNMSSDAKTAVQQLLAAEQGHLCCYCMARLDPTPDASGKVKGMKIEHWLPQSNVEAGKDLELDFRNMLGACPGNEGSPPRLQHCDTRKGFQTITIDPREPSPHPQRIHYTVGGAVRIDDPSLQADIDQRLNLNADRLKANRKAAVDEFVQQLQRSLGPEREWTTRQLQQVADGLRTLKQGRLLPYVEVLLFWLRKRDSAVI